MLTIPNGTGPSERIGRHIDLHDMTMNYEFKNSVNVALVSCRAVLVFDKQTNATLPGITDIMNGTDVVALFNPDNRSASLRYGILE